VGQAETERKYVGDSGERIRYFTPPRLKVLVTEKKKKLIKLTLERLARLHQTRLTNGKSNLIN
jgi:hypothetical protein